MTFGILHVSPRYTCERLYRVTVTTCHILGDNKSSDLFTNDYGRRPQKKNKAAKFAVITADGLYIFSHRLYLRKERIVRLFFLQRIEQP